MRKQFRGGSTGVGGAAFYNK